MSMSDKDIPDPVAFRMVMESVENAGISITETITNPNFGEISKEGLKFVSAARRADSQAMAEFNARMNARESEGYLLGPQFARRPDDLRLCEPIYQPIESEEQ
jgi:hypothetical protein